MANTEDLRYVRTEAAIRTAFMGLVKEMPVSSVTASAVCRRANISRNAFYLHHSSVSELCATLMKELVDDVRSECVAFSARCALTGSDSRLDRELLKALSRHETLLRSLLPADDGRSAKLLAEGIEGAFIDAALEFGPHGRAAEHRLRCVYSAWGTIGFVTFWIAQTARPLEQAIESYQTIQDGIVKASARFLIDGAGKPDSGC